MSTVTFFDWIEKVKRSRQVAEFRGRIVQLLALSNCCELVKRIKSFPDLMKVITKHPYLKEYRIDFYRLWLKYCESCGRPS